MPQAPIICAPMAVAAARSEAGPVDTSSNQCSSATMPPMAIWSSACSSSLLLVKRSSVSECCSRPSESRRFTMESTSSWRRLAHEVGHRGVPGLVGGHAVALVRRVDGLVRDAELDEHLGLGDVGHRHGRATVGQCDHQCLVHQPLQRGRGVAEGHAGDDVDGAVLVEISGVRLLAQVVGDDVAAGAPPRQPEVDGAVEASRADERRVEVVLAVGGPHHQHVGGNDGRLVQLAAVGEVAVEQVDPGPGDALAAGRGVEGLQLHEQLVDHARHAFVPAAATHARAEWPRWRRSPR